MIRREVNIMFDEALENIYFSHAHPGKKLIAKKGAGTLGLMTLAAIAFINRPRLVNALVVESKDSPAKVAVREPSRADDHSAELQAAD